MSGRLALKLESRVSSSSDSPKLGMSENRSVRARKLADVLPSPECLRRDAIKGADVRSGTKIRVSDLRIRQSRPIAAARHAKVVRGDAGRQPVSHLVFCDPKKGGQRRILDESIRHLFPRLLTGFVDLYPTAAHTEAGSVPAQRPAPFPTWSRSTCGHPTRAA